MLRTGDYELVKQKLGTSYTECNQSLPNPHSRQRRSIANQERIRLDSPWERMRKDSSYFRVGSPRSFGTAIHTAVKEEKCELYSSWPPVAEMLKH